MAPSANIKARLSGKGFSKKPDSLEGKQFKDVRDKLILKKRMQIKDARDKLVEKNRHMDMRQKLNQKKGQGAKQVGSKDLRNGKPKAFSGNKNQTGIKIQPSNARVNRFVGNKTGPKNKITQKFSNMKNNSQNLRNTQKRQKDARSFPPSAKKQIAKTRSPKFLNARDIRPLTRAPARPQRYQEDDFARSRLDDNLYDSRSRFMRKPEENYSRSDEFNSRRYSGTRPDYRSSLRNYADTFDDLLPKLNSSYMDYPSRDSGMLRSSSYRRSLDDYGSSRLSGYDLADDYKNISDGHHLPSSTEYKLIVSNIHEGVTIDELYSLFSNIGSLIDCRFLKTGLAEVIYAKKKDALDAIGYYNQRLLDDMPLSVTLVDHNSVRNDFLRTGRHVLSSDDRPMKRSITTRYKQSPNFDFQPDISTIHEALFRGAPAGTNRRRF